MVLILFGLLDVCERKETKPNHKVAGLSLLFCPFMGQWCFVLLLFRFISIWIMINSERRMSINDGEVCESFSKLHCYSSIGVMILQGIIRREQ